MDPPGLPEPPGSPKPTRGGPTFPTVPSGSQPSAALTANNEVGAATTDQSDSLEALTKRTLLAYVDEAHRLGYLDKHEVDQLGHLTGQQANMILSVRTKLLYCFSA